MKEATKVQKKNEKKSKPKQSKGGNIAWIEARADGTIYERIWRKQRSECRELEWKSKLGFFPPLISRYIREWSVREKKLSFIKSVKLGFASVTLKFNCALNRREKNWRNVRRIKIEQNGFVVNFSKTCVFGLPKRMRHRDLEKKYF